MSLFSSIFTSTFTLGQFLIAVLASMVLGFVVSIYYMFRNTYSKSFVPSLILIPAIECVVIIMINGNMGAGIAVAGSFALIRFRSARGSAKDLTAFLWLWQLVLSVVLAILVSRYCSRLLSVLLECS